MQEKELAEKIAKAMDFNLSQIFNEIDLKVKRITHTKAELIAAIPPSRQETKVLIFSEFKFNGISSKAVISFNKKNALMMIDLIKGLPLGTTKIICTQEVNALKGVSINLFKAYLNSLNSVAGTKAELSEPDIVFSFSSFENEFVAGNLKGDGRFLEFDLVVGGTEIKGEMKFFALKELIA
jgi:chemotaxis protein CheY-P-specific phosphatase CheC